MQDDWEIETTKNLNLFFDVIYSLVIQYSEYFFIAYSFILQDFQGEKFCFL